ncbi:TadE/TadG family type IV pilus assembly protein [Curvivirga aplysinae]|uniref:TadE/TadG family type IV pilus assembly protein n=1 Tax=Curvivirga aplysinae TaxID=2529852 RepID=UPI001C3FADB8|nr:TadE/TadG family type IV pilus assembly protein [Curvivirga aplysinae]
MHSYILGKFKKFKADEKGVFSVEFALVLPFLLVLMFGTIEVGLVMFTQSLMEGALRDASRHGITGQEADADARLEAIIQIIEDKTIGLVDMDTAQIDILTYESFGQIGEGEAYIDGDGNGQYDLGETYTDENDNGIWDSDVGNAGPGDAGDVVLYRIRYDWPIIAGYAKNFLGNDDGKLPLSASVAVRNEPWDLIK